MNPKTLADSRPFTKVILGQPSWRLSSDQVEAFITETGGHVGPVTFDRRRRKIKPYSVAPWAEEQPKPPLIPILQVLRGDFFCLPFGGNELPFRGEQHPAHGETANNRWHFESLQTRDRIRSLHLSLRTKIRPGRVDKRISLVAGQNAVYSEHIVSGMTGPMNLGHHAMLKFPDRPGSGIVSTSRFVFGQVLPGAFESPEKAGYSALKPGAEFTTLEKVPMADGGNADVTRYPARRGFEDLLMMVSDPEVPFAWTAVSFPQERFVWFALKDPCVLRETVFWISNGGRHYPPWNSRHTNVMGLEEVTSCFHLGLAPSARPNSISRRGFPTCHRLDPEHPLAVRYIMGVVPTPAGLDRVYSIEPAVKRDGIRLVFKGRRSVNASVQWNFLREGFPSAQPA